MFAISSPDEFLFFSDLTLGSSGLAMERASCVKRTCSSYFNRFCFGAPGPAFYMGGSRIWERGFVKGLRGWKFSSGVQTLCWTTASTAVLKEAATWC